MRMSIRKNACTSTLAAQISLSMLSAECLLSSSPYGLTATGYYPLIHQPIVVVNCAEDVLFSCLILNAA